MTLCSAVRQVRPQLGGFRVTHRWTLGMPIKTFNELRRASKRQSGQTWEKVYWNPQPSPGARTAAFGFSAHLIHFSVWLLGGQPESDSSGQKNAQKNLNNEEMKMFACIAKHHVCAFLHRTSVHLSIWRRAARWKSLRIIQSSSRDHFLWFHWGSLSRQTPPRQKTGVPTVERRIYNTCLCVALW